MLAGRALYVHIEDIVMPGEHPARRPVITGPRIRWRMTVLTTHLRAERRAFIRDHHPDRGGDPDDSSRDFTGWPNRLSIHLNR